MTSENPKPPGARDRGFNSKQMGDACEMLVAAELTLNGMPALKVTDFWPDYDVIAQPRDGKPQRISVKSATPGKNYSRVGFDPTTCDWLAIVLFENKRRIFLIPSGIAKKHSSEPPKAHKRSAFHLYFAKLRKEPLSRYENNFTLRRRLRSGGPELRDLEGAAKNGQEGRG